MPQPFKFTREVDMQSMADVHAYLAREVEAKRLTEGQAGEQFSVLMVRGITVGVRRGFDEAPSVYQAVTSRSATPNEPSHTYAGVGLPGLPEPVEPGEPIPRTSLTTDRATIVNSKHALALDFTREDVRYDRTGTLQRRANDLGGRFPIKRDIDALDFFNNGTTRTIYDGDAVFANSHPNRTGSGANSANDNLWSVGALSQANLETALDILAGWKDYDGNDIAVDAEAMVVASNQRWEAARLMTSAAEVKDNRGHSANVHAGTMQVVHWQRLTASTWYVKTRVPGFLFQVDEDLRVERESTMAGESFWRDLSGAVKAAESRGFGVIDWRWGAKGN